MPEITEMNRHAFSIAYAGAGRDGEHSINVETLAPALLAFGKLMREANAELNGDRAKANVYVVSDFEHKCFNINFDLVVGFYEQVRSLVKEGDVQDAKNILEWVGLLAAPPSAIGATFFSYLRWKRGRKTSEVTVLTDESQKGNVSVKVEGDNNAIIINQKIYTFSQNSKALKATRDAFLPIGQDGFERVEIRDSTGAVLNIEPDEVRDIVSSCTTAITETKEREPDIEVTTAWLSVYSPVYDEQADRWRFRLGTEPVYVDISDTSIVHEAMLRGGALIDDTYQVKLEVTTDIDEQGNRSKPKYKALDVIRFIPATPVLRQVGLFESKEVPPDEAT